MNRNESEPANSSKQGLFWLMSIAIAIIFEVSVKNWVLAAPHYAPAGPGTPGSLPAPEFAHLITKTWDGLLESIFASNATSVPVGLLKHSLVQWE